MQSADSAQAREFLQDEVEICRRAAFATFQVWAAVATTFDRLAFLRTIGVLTTAGPAFPFGMLGRPAQCLHLVVWRIAVGDLHEFSVAQAALSRPESVFRWAYFSWVVMKEDHGEFRRLVPKDFGDIRCGLPIHRLAPQSSPLENEMKKRSRTSILIIGRRPFPDSDLNCHREFLQRRAVLIMG